MELSDIAQSSTPSSNPEVNHSNKDNVPLENTNVDRNNGGDCQISGGDGDTGQPYELPHRTTRGVPPRRYSPNWKGRKSRYAVMNIVQGHLTEMARAFEVALYEEEEIP